MNVQNVEVANAFSERSERRAAREHCKNATLLAGAAAFAAFAARRSVDDGLRQRLQHCMQLALSQNWQLRAAGALISFENFVHLSPNFAKIH